ncbi:hypothetical protein RvY_12181-2 [Ramazzottius varieornatus]|uniref:Receptor ligand binding region domain-containing protein n=1 Tax=Ramazzottius varieornatus TaxID=947166 RepID=A0A1D1VIL1_RAMVA|nr:hypothetical protein RvY_12181-2 [Ramazzottius varieornatus]
MEYWQFVGYVVLSQEYFVRAVHFVTILYRGGSLGYEALTPAFDVAFEQGKQKYQLDYTWTNYELINSTSFCDEDALSLALIPMVDLYKRHRLVDNRPVIIYFPGCSFPFSPVGDFAREMDWLAILSGPLNEQWLDAKRYTNTIRYGATESVLLGKAFLSLLDVYSWRRLSVIFDSQKGDRRGLNIRTQQECMPILGLLRQRAADFHFLQIDVDSTDPKANLSEPLLAAKTHSRIILLCTSVHPFQRFLNVARELNMTSTHVFVFVFGLEVPEERYFDLDHMKENPENTTELFRNVLVIRTIPFPWLDAASSIQLIKQRKRSDSSFAADMFSYNEFMMNSFDAVQSTMIVSLFCSSQLRAI